MRDILREHALRHYWAESVQDRQYVIKPNRITSTFGAHKVARLMWEGVRLPNYADPTDNTTFHLYSIGQLPPWLFALDLKCKQWYRCDELGEENTVVVDIYADNGAIIPRAVCYLYVNYDKTLVLAVARNKCDLGTYPKKDSYGVFHDSPYTLDRHGLTIRFYSNAILQSEQWRENAINPQVPLKELSMIVKNVNDYTKFMQQVAAIEVAYGKQGGGTYYDEGFIISKPKGYLPAYANRRLSYHYDETVRETYFFKIRDLTGFKSKLDRNADKYLLVSPTNHEHIDFFDDLDFYVIKRDNSNNYRGVMIDRLHASNLRQVTHNAWAVRADQVIRLSSEHRFLNLVNTLEIMVVVRNGGMMHPLEYQAPRIEELYHLPRSEIIEAMSLAESSVEFWRAPDLENSAYIKVMSSKAHQITQSDLNNAYGYNAATKAVHKSLYKVVGGNLEVDPAFLISTTSLLPNPVENKSNRVVFWHDVEGLLLGYQVDDTTNLKIKPESKFSAAVYAEVFQGVLGTTGTSDGSFPDQAVIEDVNYGFYGYRNYVCNIVNGTRDNKWQDVTNSSYASYIPSTNGKPPRIEWNYNLLNDSFLYPCTRIANTINVREQTFRLNAIPGVIEILLTAVIKGSIAPIAGNPGHVDVFMNGRPLIIDLDFYYDQSGKIVITKQITSVDLVDNTDEVKFVVRWYGYGDPELQRTHPSRDTGFVKNGRISHNQIFNPIHDRVVRINIGGRLYTYDEVSTAESDGTLKTFDGKPYSVEDYQPLVEVYTGLSTVDYQLEAKHRDVRVSEYLTPRLPEPKVVDNFISVELWELYSPIMGELIYLMTTGMIDDAVLDIWDGEKSLFTNVQQYMNKYKDEDPCIVGFNDEFCKVAPYPYKTTRDVTAKQYAALERINVELLNNVIDLTNYLTIK